jgi:hypothetical protein
MKRRINGDIMAVRHMRGDEKPAKITENQYHTPPPNAFQPGDSIFRYSLSAF